MTEHYKDYYRKRLCIVLSVILFRYIHYRSTAQRDESIEDALECGIDPRAQCANKD